MTKDQALTANNFTHANWVNKDGTPLRARRNGKTKTWKTRPNDFRIPVKWGLKTAFYITNHTDRFWNPAN